ncbi:hypothetical protein SESBI_35362 [Sesbania bispinosa]|nr:hypothetical protein SESBI_35362 [Sesbania bispinosa]
MNTPNVGGKHIIVVGVPVVAASYPTWFEGQHAMMTMIEQTVIVYEGVENTQPSSRAPPSMISIA